MAVTVDYSDAVNGSYSVDYSGLIAMSTHCSHKVVFYLNVFDCDISGVW
jgi:hypothetical protein